MPDPASVERPEAGPAALRVRAAVRDFLADPDVERHLRSGIVGVAVSGGADSLALADATAHVAGKLGLRSVALVVDHGLQAGSAEVAAQAAGTATDLGVSSARVLTVQVEGPGGPEAAARRARYAALRAALPSEDALILLGHTLDDQAETVLLGLGRGSGPRSVAGMRPLDPPWGRPLLGVSGEVTRQACREFGARPWADPHNADPRFQRVRLRTEVLPLLEDVLQGGVAAALARTAAQVREDLEAWDVLAADLLGRAVSEASEPTAKSPDLQVTVLEPAPPALRRRALRRWLLDAGARDLTEGHLRSVDALIGRWRGQGGVWLPGNLVVDRSHGRLQMRRAESASESGRGERG